MWRERSTCNTGETEYPLVKLNLLSGPWRVELVVIFAPSRTAMHVTAYVEAPSISEAGQKAEQLARAAAAQRCPIGGVRVSFAKHERSCIVMEGPAMVVQTSAPADQWKVF